MAADQEVAAQPVPREDPARPVRILLVDDRPENLLALEAILTSLDHELVRAGSGEEALKALLTTDFALILLDASMPGMDGFETAARIKRRERTRDIPILFLTAYQNEPQHAFRGYEVGAVDYLTKPFDPWILRAKVSVFVDLYLKNRQLQEQAALLRQQLSAVADAAGRSGADLVGELSGRVGAVEEQVAVLVAAAVAVAGLRRHPGPRLVRRDAAGGQPGQPRGLRRLHDHDQVVLPGQPVLDQQRDVEDHHRVRWRGRQRLGGPLRHQRVHYRVQPAPGRLVGEHDRGQPGPVQPAVRAAHPRPELRQHGLQAAAARLDHLAGDGVGVDDDGAVPGQQAGHRALARADPPGQPDLQHQGVGRGPSAARIGVLTPTSRVVVVVDMSNIDPSSALPDRRQDAARIRQGPLPIPSITVRRAAAVLAPAARTLAAAASPTRRRVRHSWPSIGAGPAVADVTGSGPRRSSCTAGRSARYGRGWRRRGRRGECSGCAGGTPWPRSLAAERARVPRSRSSSRCRQPEPRPAPPGGAPAAALSACSAARTGRSSDPSGTSPARSRMRWRCRTTTARCSRWPPRGTGCSRPARCRPRA